MTRGPLISVSCVLSISVGSSSLDLGATVRDLIVQSLVPMEEGCVVTLNHFQVPYTQQFCEAGSIIYHWQNFFKTLKTCGFGTRLKQLTFWLTQFQLLLKRCFHHKIIHTSIDFHEIIYLYRQNQNFNILPYLIFFPDKSCF